MREASSGKHSPLLGSSAPLPGCKEGPGAVSKEKELHPLPPDSFELRTGFEKAVLTSPFFRGVAGQVVYCSRVPSQAGEQQVEPSLCPVDQGTLVG